MIGVDEVGRGAWAGPLLVCAVRLRGSITGLKDSKKLSAKNRQRLSSEILNMADIGYGWIDSTTLDAIGLSEALRRATAAALAEVTPGPNELIIIDGAVNFAPTYTNVKTAIKADDLYPAVSAASIVAKVARDAYMTQLGKTLPDYGFERHVGYGTALHSSAIKLNGFCAEHRRSFRLPEPA